MGATRVARALAAFAVTVLLVWLALPIARAYLLVAGHSADVPAPQDLPFEEVRFSPDDGTDLDGWFLRAAGEAPAVVLVHGFKSSRLEMIPWARFLHAAGYGVLLFDTRACGKSGGRTVGLGATEARDVSAAVSQVRSTARTTKVAVLGVSLGAGAAILAAADDPSITAVVADSAWTDQDFQLARLLFVQAGPLRVPLPPYGIAAVDMLVGANVESARPLDVIKRIAPRPILLIHSADDDNATTPIEGARRLFAAAAEPKQLWVVPRGGHIGAMNAFPHEYRSRVLAFLGEALR